MEFRNVRAILGTMQLHQNIHREYCRNRQGELYEWDKVDVRE